MTSKAEMKQTTLSLNDDTKNAHIDSKAKRMQGFLKRIAKSKSILQKAPTDSSNKEIPTAAITTTINTEVKSPLVKETEEERLKKLEKDVKSALTYYKVILNKNVIQKLPGTATAVLESIINAEETIEKCIQLFSRMKGIEMDMAEVTQLKQKLHRSITHLVRVSDDVLFDSYLHVRVDEISALKAADAVLLSLDLLYKNVLPSIKKYSLNAELLKYSSSHHSSSNSLDDLDNIPETDILDDHDGPCNETFNESLNTTISDPPPKPPLPNANRSYYGNYNGHSICKSLSHPGETMSPILKEPVSRPMSHLSSEPANLFNLGSRSSLSTVSSSSLNSPLKFGSSQFFDNSNRNGSQAELSDMSDSGMSNETLRKLQSFSQNYEALAKSTISLFNGDEDMLNSDVNDDPAPELPSKKKVKHKAENYLQIVGDYYNDRPSSMYDNLPIGTLPNINNVDELVRGDGLPKLPPKTKYYEHRGSSDEIGHFKSSQVIKNRKSRRESSVAYEEDNIPALDCRDVSHLLYFKKETDQKSPVLCGGTVDALIVYATQVETDNVYYKAFLATYRTFISPAELICKLLYRANRFQTKAKNSSYISTSVLQLLVQVFEEMFEELDKSLFDQLRSQVHRLLNSGELKLGKSLRDKLVSYCIKLQVNHLPTYEPEKSNDEIFDFKSFEIAQQMCLLDASYFIKIELPEILRWGKEQSETLSPNLSRFISHFNSMSFWVRTLMLKETRQQEREKMYKKFLKIMRILKRLNNFSSFLAILSALDSTPLRRLDWPKQYTELLAEDTKLIESSSGFKVYRETLAEAKLPCIPYLGLILTDITFVHLGNSHELPDGKINFVKRWQQFNILDSVRRFKAKMYNYEKNEKILDFFNEYEDHMDEDEMWDQSILLKPRGK